MYVTSYRSFKNLDNSTALSEIEKTYNSNNQAIKNEYAVIYKLIKTKNTALSSKLKDIHSHYFRCLQYEESRQFLIEEHCNHNSISLSRHNLYHDNSNELRESILSYFSKYKTFLNEVAVYLSRTDLKDIRGIRSKSFGSMLESLKYIDSDMNLIQVLKDSTSFNEKVFFFRDKFIEHPKKTYDFYIETKPFCGSMLIPAIVSERNRSLDETIKDELAEANEDPNCFLELTTMGIASKNLFNYYYHIRDKNQQYLKETGIELYAKSIPSYEVFDNTKSHFSKYGIHYHIFPDPELESLAKSINIDMGKIENKEIIMLDYISPNYILCQKHLYYLLKIIFC